MAISDFTALEPSTDLAREVQHRGDVMGLPCIAVSPDISSPEPLLGSDGQPLAESLFTWVTPSLHYWKERDFALRSPFCRAIRAVAEPFYVVDGRATTWRPSKTLDSINEAGPVCSPGVKTAIVAPAHLPRGQIGVVVWASSEDLPIKEIFDENAVSLFALSMKFISTYNEATEVEEEDAPRALTRREVQCLKWAAAGKTDADIAEIVQISVPTVRFHITNAWKKLHVVGRSQAIYRATTLGYLGGRMPH